MEVETSKEYNLNSLIEMKRRVVSRAPSSKLKYLHLKSIDNFLFHFHDLLLMQKEKVYLMILEYLVMIDDDSIAEIDALKSKSLFEEYVYPIAKIYDEYLGFTIYGKAWILVVWGIIISCLFAVLNAPSYFYLIIIIGLSVMYTRIALQAKRKKVYGYFY